MTNDFRTAATNTAYLAVGIGVVTAQQVQRGAESAIQAAAERVRSVAPAPAEVREKVEARVTPIVEQVRFVVEPSLDSLRAQAEGMVVQAGETLDQAGTYARERIEPTIEKVRTRFN